jgi:hypothetical protein
MLALLAAVALFVSSLRAAVVEDVKPAERGDGSEPGERAGGDGGAGETRPRVANAGSTPLRKNPGSPYSDLATATLPSDPVRAARRFAALVVILEGLRELLDPLRSGDGDTYRAGGLLLLPHAQGCWFHRDGRTCTCPLSGALEAERLLDRMPRFYARQVRGWFVDVERRGRWVWRKRKLVRERVVARRPGSELGPARAGVEWMARHWGLRDARGELVEPWLVAPGVDRAA